MGSPHTAIREIWNAGDAKSLDDAHIESEFGRGWSTRANMTSETTCFFYINGTVD